MAYYVIIFPAPNLYTFYKKLFTKFTWPWDCVEGIPVLKGTVHRQLTGVESGTNR